MNYEPPSESEILQGAVTDPICERLDKLIELIKAQDRDYEGMRYFQRKLIELTHELNVLKESE